MHTTPLPMLLEPRRLPGLYRRRRRPFTPQADVGPYRLPRSLQERLTADLAPHRNAEAAFKLFLFLARYQSAPGRLDRPFPIDRRALAGHRHLGLTEGEIRGAIKTLYGLKLIERLIPEGGSRYRATEAGLHRKPILFRFTAETKAAFSTTNRRRTLKPPSRASAPRSNLMAPNLPKNKIPTGTVVLMGELRKGLPIKKVLEPNSKLEAAIQRLKEAIKIP